MFTWFTKKKQITVDCFTSSAVAYNMAPVVRSSKTIPDWWKTLQDKPKVRTKGDKLEVVEQNMKECYGFKELYKRGIVIEHWCDLQIRITNDSYTHVFTNASHANVEEHSKSQYRDGFKNYHHIKLVSPWAFVEKTGIHFIMLGAEWANEDVIVKFLPGVVEYSVNHSTNINLMLPALKNPYEMNIPLGHPLVHVIPLNDDINVKYKTHLVSDEEYKKLRISNSSFMGHSQLLKIIKRNGQRESKCPFG